LQEIQKTAHLLYTLICKHTHTEMDTIPFVTFSYYNTNKSSMNWHRISYLSQTWDYDSIPADNIVCFV